MVNEELVFYENEDVDTTALNKSMEEYLNVLYDFCKKEMGVAAVAHQDAGNKAYEEKNYEEAMKEYEMAIEMIEEMDIFEEYL